MNKKCEKCGQDIFNVHHNVKYCKECLTKNCIHCGNEFKIRPGKFDMQYCSKKCRFAKPEYHPLYNKQHSEDSKVKMSESNWMKKLKKSGSNIPSEALKGLEKGQKWFAGKTKEDCPQIARRAKILSQKYAGKPNPEQSKRLKEFYKNNPEKHPNRLMAEKGRRTSIEQIMFDALNLNQIEFRDEFPLLGYYIDFALVEYKIAIECDGAYWHNPEKDKIRDGNLLEAGWVTLRFEEKVIKKDIQSCVDKINKEISRRKCLIS